MRSSQKSVTFHLGWTLPAWANLFILLFLFCRLSLQQLTSSASSPLSSLSLSHSLTAAGPPRRHRCQSSTAKQKWLGRHKPAQRGENRGKFESFAKGMKRISSVI